MPCLPLTLAIVCGWDISVIKDLLSTGVVLGRDQKPEAQLPIIIHLEDCSQVEDARKCFVSTLQELRRLCKVIQEGGSNADWQYHGESGAGIMHELFKTASSLLGDDSTEQGEVGETNDVNLDFERLEGSDRINTTGDLEYDETVQGVEGIHIDNNAQVITESKNVDFKHNFERLQDDQQWNNMELGVAKSPSLCDQKSWILWRKSFLELLQTALQDNSHENPARRDDEFSVYSNFSQTACFPE